MWMQALLAYVQLVTMLVILDIEWPPALGFVFKLASALLQLTPQVRLLFCVFSCETVHNSITCADRLINLD